MASRKPDGFSIDKFLGVDVPVSYSFDVAIVVVKAAGHYTTDDLKTVTLASLADAAVPARPVAMFDLRESKALTTRSSSQLADMALFLETLGPRFNNRFAFLVLNALGYGLMRMGGAWMESPTVQAEIFRDYDDAREWLLRSAGD